MFNHTHLRCLVSEAAHLLNIVTITAFTTNTPPFTSPYLPSPTFFNFLINVKYRKNKKYIFFFFLRNTRNISWSIIGCRNFWIFNFLQILILDGSWQVGNTIRHNSNETTTISQISKILKNSSDLHASLILRQASCILVLKRSIKLSLVTR